MITRRQTSKREDSNMNRKRLGQFLIGGVFTACAVVVTALIDLVTKETQKAASAGEKPEEQAKRE